MKNGKICQKINFSKSDGAREHRLLTTQNNRSFSCAPCFDQVLIEKPQKSKGIFVRNPTFFVLKKYESIVFKKFQLANIHIY